MDVAVIATVEDAVEVAEAEEVVAEEVVTETVVEEAVAVAVAVVEAEINPVAVVEVEVNLVAEAETADHTIIPEVEVAVTLVAVHISLGNAQISVIPISQSRNGIMIPDPKEY